MIRRIEALIIDPFADVDVSIGNFEILVGPNGSGKVEPARCDRDYTWGYLASRSPRAILGDAAPRDRRSRSPDPAQLRWMRQGDRFELAVEASIRPRSGSVKKCSFDSCRYRACNRGAGSSGDEVSLLARPLVGSNRKT